MTTSRNKPLADWTDDEIDASLRSLAPHVAYSFTDLAREQERRRAKQDELAFGGATVAAAIAAIASAVAAFLALARI